MITKQSTGLFEIVTKDAQKYLAERVLLATGMQEEFPSILMFENTMEKAYLAVRIVMDGN